MRSSMLRAIVALAALLVSAASAFAQQYAAPVGTISNSGFTAQGDTTLHWTMDERPPDDATTYTWSASRNADFNVNLFAGLIPPPSTTSHFLYVRAQTSTGVSSSMTVELRQGGTIIQSFNQANIGTTWTTYTFSVTNAANITNYATLSVYAKLTSRPDTGAQFRISTIELEVPSPPAVPTVTAPTVTLVTQTGATLGATVAGTGITARGTVWNTTGAPVTQNPLAEGGTATGAFTHARTGMAAALRVYFAGYATNSGGTGYSTVSSFYTEPNQVGAAGFTGVGQTQFTVTWTVPGTTPNAVVFIRQGAPVASVPGDGTTYVANPVFGAGPLYGVGDYVVYTGVSIPSSVTVTGLTAGTTYHVAVYGYAGIATMENYNVTPSAWNSTTTTSVVPPTLASPTATNVDLASAVLGATITSNGTGTITARGTLWNSVGPPISENLAPEGGTALGAFSHLRDLMPAATRIWFRGYAINEAGVGYTSDSSFWTEPNSATGATFANVTATSMRVSWTVGDGVGRVVLMKASSGIDATPADGTEYTGSAAFGSGTQLGAGNWVVHAGTGTQVDVTGLTPGVTYYVAVFEYAGLGSGATGVNYQQGAPALGAQATVAGVPVLLAPLFTAVTDTSANLGATIDSDGGAPVLARGTVWGTAAAPTGNVLAEGGTSTGAFSHARTGLPSATRIYFRGYATNASGTAYSADTTFYTEPNQASGVTFTNITGTGMTVTWTRGNGQGVVVLMRQGSAVTASPVDGTVYTGNAAFGSGTQVGSGNYVVYAGTATTVNVTGLSSVTPYYVAVYEYAGSGTGVSGINYQQASAATGNQSTSAGPPSLSSPTFSSITDTAATLGATITADGGGAITARGTVWNTTGAPITQNPLAEGGTATGAFTHARTGLPSGTRIWLRGYATNSGGTGYSPDGTFFTEPTQASLVTLSSVTSTGFTVSWVAGNGTGAIVLVKSGSAADGSPTDGVEHAASASFGAGAQIGTGNYVVYRGTGASVDVVGLTGGTTYHVAVFAYAGTGAGASGVNYQQDLPTTGSQLTATPVTLPTVASPTFSSIDTTTATLGATVVSDGGVAITARGTVWNTTGSPVVENSLADGGTGLTAFTQARTGLTSGSKLYFRGYASNSGGTGYSPGATFYTEPTQASSVTFNTVRSTAATITWAAGGGDGVLIVMKAGSAVTAAPTDGVEHAASNGFGGGAALATGEYVVYRGAANSVTVVGLTPQSIYYVAAYEYAGTGTGAGGINYQQTTPATGNVSTVVATTHNALHNIACATCHSVWGTFVPRNSNQEAACAQCHNPTGAASNKSNIGLHVVNSGTTTVDCGQCHEVHNSSTYSFVTNNTHTGGTSAANIKFLRWNMKKYQTQALEPTVFQQRPAHFAFTTTPYNGVCETCHTQTARWTNDGLINRNSSTPADMTHEAGADCASCHVHSRGFRGNIDNCLSSGCHGTPPGAPNTAPDIQSQFARTSHHVLGGNVTNADCGVCHEEARNAAHHADGKVDLLDPDNASTVITLARPITRNRSSNTLEASVTTLQTSFCLKCHDSDGATATFLAGKSALRPFSAASRDVPNVNSQFANTMHHAVTAFGNNPYTTPTTTNGSKVTMLAPWNQTANSHNKITCFDCHDLSGHGGVNQRMLRDPINLATMEATTNYTNLPVGMGATVETFCTRCHAASVYVSSTNSGTAGSVYEYHGQSQSSHGAGGGNNIGCFGCHAGIVNYGGIANNGAQRGNVHGRTFVWPTGTFSSGFTTDSFILGGWISGWNFSGATGYCQGGQCNHANSSKNYSR